MNILHRLWRQEQYYTAFLGGFAAMPLVSGIIKRFIRFIRNKYNIPNGRQNLSAVRFSIPIFVARGILDAPSEAIPCRFFPQACAKDVAHYGCNTQKPCQFNELSEFFPSRQRTVLCHYMPMQFISLALFCQHSSVS